MDMAAKRKRKIFARLRRHFVAVHSTKEEYLHRNYLLTSRKPIRIANLKPVHDEALGSLPHRRVIRPPCCYHINVTYEIVYKSVLCFKECYIRQHRGLTIRKDK
jgi:hypothetical protein